MRRVCALAPLLALLAACASPGPVAGSSASPSTSPSPARSETEIPYAPSPETVRTAEGLTLPVPPGWFGRDLTPQSVGSYWDLIDHDPAKKSADNFSIVIRTGDPATAEEKEDVQRCPKQLEEARLVSCSFVEFGGHRWKRIVGEGDTAFVDFTTVVDGGFYRVIGVAPRGSLDTLNRLEPTLREAMIDR